MAQIKLYPPNGIGEPVIPHPAKVEQMKQNGWTEKPAKPKTSKEDK